MNRLPQFLFLLLALTCCTTKVIQMEDRFGDGELEGAANPNTTGKKNGWSTNGQLTVGDPDGQVSLQRTFRKAGMFTLTFFADYPRDVVDTVVRAEADIDWTVAGNTIRRRVTLANGLAISGLCESVRVVAVDVTTLGVGATPVDYDVGISVAEGVRAPNPIPPTLSSRERVRAIANGAFDTFDVPDGVGINGVMVVVMGVNPAAPLPDNSILVQVETATGIGLLRYDPNQVGPKFMPISGDSDHLFIQNDSGQIIEYTVIFSVEG